MERWFGFLTDQMIRRGAHKSVRALEADIRAWIEHWNDDPKPFVWKRPRTRSSIPWHDIFGGFQARDTSESTYLTDTNNVEIMLRCHRDWLLSNASATE